MALVAAPGQANPPHDPPLMYARWHDFHNNSDLQRSLENTRQKWLKLTAKQCIVISLNYAQFLQPSAYLNDRAFDNHHLYFIVLTEQQFLEFEMFNRVRNRMWFEYQSYSNPAQESEGDDLMEPKKKNVDPNSRIKVKNHVVTGKQRRRNRYFICPESFQSITGTPLPMPRIMILQYFMLPNMNSDQRRITLEAGNDPPVPRGMTMAMPLIRKYQQAPEPANVPQHGVPLQQPHDYLEEMGKCDTTDAKNAEEMASFSSNIMLLKDLLLSVHENVTKTQEMIVNNVSSSKEGDGSKRLNEMTWTREGPAPSVVPSHVPPPIVPSYVPPHNREKNRASDSEASAIQTLDKGETSDAKNEEMTSLSSDVLVLKDMILSLRENVMKMNEMIVNNASSSKDNHEPVMSMIREHVGALSRAFLSLKVCRPQTHGMPQHQWWQIVNYICIPCTDRKLGR
ncbi:uncharacterized protein [Triticum aestivum]|uniref:uncharacterized protein isoform X2 n=1 Tax=Triticum aestivum TaxID=4565 RepID=UPI001D00F972|nr:uncharacterized protein LOC123075167 isoform X2 [Triticum aestivum]